MFLEFPLVEFLRMRPDLEYLFPFHAGDPRYIIRIDPVSQLMEVGYQDDPWVIG